MMTENIELMRMSRESLHDKWGLAIGAFLVYTTIVTVIQLLPFVGTLASFIMTGPFALGISSFWLSISRNQKPTLEQIFHGFDNFGTALAAYLLSFLFTFLWMLLLIIPGIIAAISYSMTFFILADDKTIGPLEAIDKSKNMMDGYKWKYFCLGMRFFGWGLLCILTCGIGFIWLVPYMSVCNAKFYEELKTNSLKSNYTF